MNTIKTSKCWLSILFLLGSLVRSYPQAPINDSFTNRLALPSSDLVATNWTNVGATKESEAGERNHARNPGGHSVWFFWRPSRDGLITIDTEGSKFDTLLAVYTGKSIGTLNEEVSDDDGGTNQTSRVVIGNGFSSRDYQIAVDGKGGATGEIRLNIRLYMAPVILVQPTNQDVTVSENGLFTVLALGAFPPLSYQWQKGTNQDIAGETNATLKLPAVQKGQDAVYSVVIANSYGKTRSNPVRLRVISKPKIDQQPQGRNVDSGETVTLTSTALGDEPLSYQWQFNAVDLPGATFTNLMLANVSTDRTGDYRMIVTNNVGSATSQVAKLVVTGRPPIITLQPTNQTVVAGTFPSMSVGAKGYQPISYQWLRNGTNLPGQMLSTLQFAPVTTNDAGVYSVSVSNLYGGTNSTNATLTVEIPPPNDFFVSRIDLGDAPATTKGFNRHGTSEPGEPKHAGQLPANSVWWSYRALGVGIATLDLTETRIDALMGLYAGTRVEQLIEIANNIDTRNGARLPKLSFLTQEGGEYAIAVDGFKGDQGDITLSIGFSTNVIPPIIEGQPKDEKGVRGVVRGELGSEKGGCADVSFRVETVSVPLVSYQWFFNGAILGGQTNSVLSLTNVVTAQSGSYYVIASNIAGSTNSDVAQLSVDPFPIIRSAPRSLTNRCGTRAQFSLSGEACQTIAYQWQFKGLNLPGETNTGFNISNVSATNAGDYRVILSNSHGSITSQVASLTVLTQPEITKVSRQPSDPTLKECVPVLFSVETHDSCAPLSFQWRFNGVDQPGKTNRSFGFDAKAESIGDYDVRVINIFGSVTSSVVGLNVDARPVISRQPEDGLRVRVGGAFTNHVEASRCSQLAYRWQLDGRDVFIDTSHFVTTNGWLVVSSARTNDSGSYQVIVSNAAASTNSQVARIEVLAAPPNDDFVNATEIGGTNFTVLGSNILATSEPDEPNHANQIPSKSVWWKWTSLLPGEVTLETSGSPTSFDTRLAVYTGTNVSALKSVAKDDNGGINNGSKLTFLAARDKTFHFAVDGNDGAEGPIELKLQVRAIISRPVITNQPLSAAARDGGTAMFDVGAEGSPDLSYQWYFYDKLLTNAIDPILVLKNVRTNDEGNYTVTIINEYGATNSHIARLTYGSIIRGQVTDATNTNGIPGAEVRVGNVSTNTDENGNYTLVDVRPADFKAEFDAVKRTAYIGDPVVFTNRSTFGAVTLIGSKEGYFSYTNNQFTVQLGEAVTNKFSLAPIFAGIRLVLNWGPSPLDLDAHVITPPFDGTAGHVDYHNKGSTNAQPYVFLDLDAQKGYGPETLTIHKFFPGTYRYYVQKYREVAGRLIDSRAIVSLYTIDGQFGVREMPTEGSGDFWHVCDIDGETQAITWVNTIQDNAPGSILTIQKPQSSGLVGSAKNERVSLASTGPGTGNLAAEYLWNFGGTGASNTSNARDPIHSYAEPRWYDVSLSLTYSNRTDTISKKKFIHVLNRLPIVTLTNPPPGRIFRFGDLIPLEANAIDPDPAGRITNVELFQIANGQTNRLWQATVPPYRYDFTNAPIGEYSFTASATDKYGDTGFAPPVRVSVRDLSGDVLIVQTAPDDEIEHLEKYISGIEVREPDGVDSHPLVPRVLDQKDLWFGLVKNFKLIIWRDFSEGIGAVTDNDVAVLSEAFTNGIPLYFIGERLATTYVLSEPMSVRWTELIRLMPVFDATPGDNIVVSNNVIKHPLFGEKFGEVTDFPNVFNLDGVAVTDSFAEVAARSGNVDVLVMQPRLDAVDFGDARSLTQTFPVLGGGDEFSVTNRQSLFQNGIWWLLRGAECDNYSVGVKWEDDPQPGEQGEPVTFKFKLINNGACDANGVVVTNFLPLSSTFVEAKPVTEAVNGVVVFKIGSIPQRGGSVDLSVTVVPSRRGMTTNEVRVRTNKRPDTLSEQSILIVGVACFEPPRLALERLGLAQVRLTIAGEAGCGYDVEYSTNLFNWIARTNITLTGPSGQMIDSLQNGERQRFYRALIR